MGRMSADKCDHPLDQRYAIYRRGSEEQRGNRGFETDGSRCGVVLDPEAWQAARAEADQAWQRLQAAKQSGNKPAEKRWRAAWALAGEKRRAAECGTAFASTVSSDRPRQHARRARA